MNALHTRIQSERESDSESERETCCISHQDEVCVNDCVLALRRHLAERREADAE